MDKRRNRTFGIAFHSGVLIDDFCFLDLGEERFLTYEPKNILITHLHPD